MNNSLRLFALWVIALVTLSMANAQNNFTLNPFTTLQPGDSIGALTFDAGFNQRGIAVDPFTTNVVIVDTHSGSVGSSFVTGNVFVANQQLSSTAVPSTLLTNGILGGNYADVAAAIADDGAVYIANQVNVSTNLAFKIYRWNSVSDPNPPVVAFSAVVPGVSQRYGTSMDIRGSGAGTQIIFGSMPGTTATNVLIFTTADGTNFSANLIGCTNVLGANFNDGITFGPTNTFWAKRINAPLLWMSYDLPSGTAKTLAVYDTTNISGIANIGPIILDTNRNLLAAIEQGGGFVSSGPERIWLFDNSDLTKAPKLLSIVPFTPNNQNATAPLGYVRFGGKGTLLYANVVNNGMIASTVDLTSTPAPSFDKDLPGTNRVATGQTAHFEVRALPNITSYQWFTNNVLVTGATNFYLDVPNVSLSDSGRVYKVVVTNPAGSATSTSSLLSTVNPADLYHLNLLWAAAGNTTNYITLGGGGTPLERTMAYNALSNQLIVVHRTTASSAQVNLFVINPDTGQVLYTLKTNGITGAANIPICGVAVAADGALYGCSGSTANDQNFRVYRWADTGSNTLPVIVFGTNASLTSPSSNPAQGATTANFRWGDVLDARGSGINTLLIVDNQDTANFRFAGTLRPTDTTMTNWTSKGFALANALGGTGIGRSLQFGVGDTFWQHRWANGGVALVESTFNIFDSDPALADVADTASGMAAFTNNGPVDADFAVNKLGAAVNFTFGGNNGGASPDTVDLYDFGAPDTPVLLNRYNFPINSQTNQNRIGQVIFTTNYVFALDANSGIVAFKLAAGPTPAPKFLAQPLAQRSLPGSNLTFTVVVDQIVTYQWQKDGVNLLNATNASLIVTNAQPSTNGSYRAIAFNATTGLSATSQVASLTVILPQDNYTISTVWATTPGTATGGTNYVTRQGANSPFERGFAYHSLSNQLIIPQRNGPPAATNSANNQYVIHVVDATSGLELYEMNTNGVNLDVNSEINGANGAALCAAAVADDGAVYICALSPNASGGAAGEDVKKFRVYRWADSGPATLPVLVFSGDPANQTNNVRWGDVMIARGSGINTELLLDDNSGTFGAILKPIDGTMTAFTNYSFTISMGSGSIGRSLQFGTTNAMYEKRHSAGLLYTTYFTNAGNSSLLTNFSAFPNTVGGVSVDNLHKVAVGVDFNSSTPPDFLSIYEISDPSTPVLLQRLSFPGTSSTNNPNANFICWTILSGNRGWSLDANNGLLAFTINGPTLTITPTPDQTKAIITWPLFSGFTLQASPKVDPPPLTWTNVGTGTIVNGQYAVTNPITSKLLFYRLIK